MVAAAASTPAPLQYLAPYAGRAIGEYFQFHGSDGQPAGESNPGRAVLSIAGVAMATGLQVVSMFTYDSVSHMLAVQFGLVQRADVQSPRHQLITVLELHVQTAEELALAPVSANGAAES